VWKSTTKVGFGYATSAGGNNAFLVVHYSPVVDYTPEAFAENVLPL